MSNNTVVQLFNIINIFNQLYLIVYIFGLVGCLFTTIIFSRNRFKKTIFFTYFRFLSLINFLTLCIRIEHYLKTTSIINLRIISSFTCKILLYFTYFLPATSGWILVVISFDRLVSVANPCGFTFRKKFRFQIIICFFTLAYNQIFYSPLLYLYHIKEEIVNNNTINQNDSKSKLCIKKYSSTVDLIDIINSTILTFILMTISTVFILKILIKSRRVLSNSGIRKKDVKFAITSVSLNFMYAILNSPLCLFMIYAGLSGINQTGDIFTLIDLIASIIYYSNYSALFYITIFVNSFFRREFIVFLNELKAIIIHE